MRRSARPRRSSGWPATCGRRAHHQPVGRSGHYRRDVPDPMQTILAARGLRVEHCDRLLNMLLDHETKASDGYVEGLRAENVLDRASLAGSHPDEAATRPVHHARAARPGGSRPQ